MYIKNWKKEVFTVPNFLSLLRLAMIPVYVTIYLNAREFRQYITAASILALSCLTDAVDGWIARKYHMISTLGKMLDPLADKLTQLTLTICLSMKYPVLMPLIVLLLGKEIGQVIGAVLLLRRGTPLPSALTAGKVSTFVLFVSLIGLVLFPSIPPIAVNIVAVIDSGFLIFAFINYYLMFFGLYAKQKHSPS